MQRLRELAVASSDPIYSAGERESMNEEFQLLLSAIEGVEVSTSFNGRKLIDPVDGGYFITMQADPEQEVITYDSSTYNITLATTELTGLDISTQIGAEAAIPIINDSISVMDLQRTMMAEQSNRLYAMVDAIGNTCWLRDDWWMQVDGAEKPCNMVVEKAPMYSDITDVNTGLQELLLRIDELSNLHGLPFTTTAMGINGAVLEDLASMVELIGNISPNVKEVYLFMVQNMSTYDKCMNGYFEPGEGFEICADL